MLNSKSRGSLLVIFSAILFGITPIAGKISYLHGNNPIMLTLLRSFFAVPVLAVLVKRKNISFAINRSERVALLWVGWAGSLLATSTLYSSYEYISVGTATTIHFLYPPFIMVASAVLFKQRMTTGKWISLALSVVGVLTFVDPTNQTNNTGVILSLLSAVAFAFFVMYLEHSCLRNMPSILVTFYIALVIVVGGIPLALATGNFTLQMTPTGWGCTIFVAMFASVIGFACFQKGVKEIGAVSAGMYSLFEPLSGLVAGYLILREEISPLTLFGCTLILLALYIYSREGLKKAVVAVVKED